MRSPEMKDSRRVVRKRQTPQVEVPVWLLERVLEEELHPTAFVLYSLLAKYANYDDSTDYSTLHLANTLNIHRATLHEHLDQLEKIGAIERTKSETDARKTIYILNFDPPKNGGAQ